MHAFRRCFYPKRLAWKTETQVDMIRQFHPPTLNYLLLRYADAHANIIQMSVRLKVEDVSTMTIVEIGHLKF